MARMDGASVDLVVTSPPYDDMRTYNGYSFNFPIVAEELFRVMKDGAVMVWVVNDSTVDGSETGTSFRQALHFMDMGYNLHDTMIWYKPNAFNFGSNLCYRQTFEYMFVLSKGRPKSINLIKDIPTKGAPGPRRGGRKHADGTRDDYVYVQDEVKRRDNVWCYYVGQEDTDHPAVFPLDLAKDMIRSWSDPGDVVYDPFMGSGTTAVAATMLRRRWIGSEISEEYCKGIEERLKPYKGYRTLEDF